MWSLQGNCKKSWIRINLYDLLSQISLTSSLFLVTLIQSQKDLAAMLLYEPHYIKINLFRLVCQIVNSHQYALSFNLADPQLMPPVPFNPSFNTKRPRVLFTYDVHSNLYQLPRLSSTGLLNPV